MHGKAIQLAEPNQDIDRSILDAVNFGDRDDFIIDLRDGKRTKSYLKGMERGESTIVAAPWLRCTRRVLDLVTASIALVVLAPVMASIAVVAKAQGNGPVFYSHERVGRGGRLFGCLKFRSMYPDADRRLAELLAADEDFRAEWEAGQKVERDPRTTPLGRFLRSTSLDELPQLVNVLRGEMSIIGPRPVVPAETVRYGPAMPTVLSIRPGLTGLWQASGRNSLSYDERVVLDLRYVREQSLWLDCKILVGTVRCLATGEGAS